MTPGRTPHTDDGAIMLEEQSVPRLLSVGRLVEKKGFHLLIDAVSSLREAGVVVEADIAGDGPMAADLERQIQRLGVQDQVRRLGARDRDQRLGRSVHGRTGHRHLQGVPQALDG